MFNCCRVGIFVTSGTVALQAPLSLGFPRQEYWRGLLFPVPGSLRNLGIESASLVLLVDSLLLAYKMYRFLIRSCISDSLCLIQSLSETFHYTVKRNRASLIAQLVKNPPAVPETPV